MIANDSTIGGTQTQLSAKLMPIIKQLTPVRHRIQKLKSISQQSVYDPSAHDGDSITNEFRTKLTKQLVKNAKISNIVHIFIQKLEQNACIVQNKSIKNKKKIQRLISQKILQIFYHLTIVYYYLGVCCLLLLSSWNASLLSFHEQMTLSGVVLALKIASLLALVIQAVVNVWSHFFKNGEGIQCSAQNLKKDLLSFNFIAKIIQIILCILFIIFPQSMVLSGILFAFEALTLIFGVNEVTHLQAAYIHTKTRNFRWKIARIFFLNILMIHNVATILILMTFLNQENNWLIQNQLNNQQWQDQYIAGYYWSTIILTTIGFGDISGTNSSQRMIVSILALFACALLAFNINTFSNIFGLLKDGIDNVESKIVMFRRMMRRDYRNNVQINPALKKRIYQYIDSLLEERKELQFIEKNQFLSNLPQKLKKDYYQDTNKNLFSDIVFLNALRNQTMQALNQNFSIHFLKQGQILEPNDLQIRILQQGSIDFTYARRGSKFNGYAYDNLTVKKRQKIVLINSDFLTLYKQSNFGMRVKQYCVTWYMTTENFLNVLKNDVVDFQFYFSVLHRHFYDVNEWSTVQCPRCCFKHKTFKHTAFKCPNLTYIPFRSVKLLKYFSISQVDQLRHKLQRKKDAAPRTSVLKYWHKYLKKNFELERKRDQQSHIKNIIISQRKHSFFDQFTKKKSHKSYHNYYTAMQKIQVVQNQQYLQIQVDTPFNFQFYMPNWNPCRLIFTEVEKCMDLAESSVLGTLKNIRYMKGQKFDYSQMSEIGR